MSAGDINFLLNLWGASLATHGDVPPFSKATHLYDTIDSTPLSDIAWESFTLQYNGTKPKSNIPSWMLGVLYPPPHILSRSEQILSGI